MGAGKPRLLGAVEAERCGLIIELYQIGGSIYRLKVRGMGWAPDSWRDYGKAFDRLIDCKSYGPREADMLRGMCRENP